MSYTITVPHIPDTPAPVAQKPAAMQERETFDSLMDKATKIETPADLPQPQVQPAPKVENKVAEVAPAAASPSVAQQPEHKTDITAKEQVKKEAPPAPTTAPTLKIETSDMSSFTMDASPAAAAPKAKQELTRE